MTMFPSLQDPPQVELRFPDKFQNLFMPKRYKVYYGGRGSAKSWSIARALLLRGYSESTRVLCVREQQNSMAESVHKLLSDQIDNLGLSGFYEIQRDKIIGANGTTFSFEGIKRNATKIKSYEGIDVCWAEECDSLSEESMLVLVPTIRKPGSEIWLSFNPNKKTDYVYRTYVLNRKRTDAFVVFVSWRDNPWFSDELRAEMEELKKTDYDAYLNVWEGRPRVLLAGAVYMEELRRVSSDGRITAVPYIREVPVDTVWDLGRADATSIWFRQRVGFEWRYIDYYEASGKALDHYLTALQERPYVYGTHFLPHDARAKSLGTGMTVEERVRKVSKTKIVRRLSLTDGIDAARVHLGSCWFDETLCEKGIEALQAYRYEVVDQLHGEYSRQPVHDWSSHCADAFRYSAVSSKQPKSGDADELERRNPELAKQIRTKLNLPHLGAVGWMAQ